VGYLCRFNLAIHISGCPRAVNVQPLLVRTMLKMGAPATLFLRRVGTGKVPQGPLDAVRCTHSPGGVAPSSSACVPRRGQGRRHEGERCREAVVLVLRPRGGRRPGPPLPRRVLPLRQDALRRHLHVQVRATTDRIPTRTWAASRTCVTV
jgi:hypothetical protein